jgi:hypothetical protein
MKDTFGNFCTGFFNHDVNLERKNRKSLGMILI